MSPDCVAVFSGGLDSTVLVYKLLKDGRTPHLVSFHYGQRHVKELAYAHQTALKLGLKHDIVDLSGITHLISNSALTSKVQDGFDAQGNVSTDVPVIEVPEGHYAEDNMKKTVVPNRNMIMLSIAAGIAVNNSYKFLATGVHAGDHFVYPDCRPQFIQLVDATIVAGNEGFGNIGKLSDTRRYAFVQAPFIDKSKEDIAFEGIQLGVPFEETWSCYKGGELHCGKCGTCVERLEAIHQATQRVNLDHGVWHNDEHFTTFDKTKYEDTKFWKGAVDLSE